MDQFTIWLLPVLIWSGTLVQNTWHCSMQFAWHWRQRAQVKSSFADHTAKRFHGFLQSPEFPTSGFSSWKVISKSGTFQNTFSPHLCPRGWHQRPSILDTHKGSFVGEILFLSSAACAVWSCTLQPSPIEGTHAAPFTAAAFEELSSAVTQKVDFCFSSSLYSSPGTEFFMQ